jgi:hypothetical protein
MHESDVIVGLSDALSKTTVVEGYTERRRDYWLYRACNIHGFPW